MHLLQAVLPSWDKTERSRDMKFLVEKLFGFLGSLLTTCSSDIPLLRGKRAPWARELYIFAPSQCCCWAFRRLFSRIYSEEEESQASGLFDCNSQQYFGRRDSGTAEDIAFTEPVEWTYKQVHQLSANLHHPHLCRKTVGRGSSHILKINSVFCFEKQQLLMPSVNFAYLN